MLNAEPMMNAEHDAPVREKLADQAAMKMLFHRIIWASLSKMYGLRNSCAIRHNMAVILSESTGKEYYLQVHGKPHLFAEDLFCLLDELKHICMPSGLSIQFRQQVDECEVHSLYLLQSSRLVTVQIMT